MKVIYIFNNNNNDVVLNDFAAQGLLRFLDLFCQEPVVKYIKVPSYVNVNLNNLDDDYDFVIINVREKQPEGEIPGFVVDTEHTAFRNIVNYITQK